jgi:Ca-activated chloride channel family protein
VVSARLDDAMVTPAGRIASTRWPSGFLNAVLLTTLVASAVLGMLAWRGGDFMILWLTPDQQGRRAYEALDFAAAANHFENAAWQGLALYRSGRYDESAAAFGRIPTAKAFFNRGNAFMKGRDYGNAITSYEQAVTEAPGWAQAQENLQLARYVLEYIEGSREQSDTGDETELGADDYVFDNTKKRGLEMEITQQSTIEAESAEKWMRSVDTETRDFLRTRFLLEASRRSDSLGGEL